MTGEKIKSALSRNVKRLRIARGISAADLAKGAGDCAVSLGELIAHELAHRGLDAHYGPHTEAEANYCAACAFCIY